MIYFSGPQFRVCVLSPDQAQGYDKWVAKPFPEKRELRKKYREECRLLSDRVPESSRVFRTKEAADTALRRLQGQFATLPLHVQEFSLLGL
jgi:hypothetical protein